MYSEKAAKFFIEFVELYNSQDTKSGKVLSHVRHRETVAP
jgi:hypothetical protein